MCKTPAMKRALIVNLALTSIVEHYQTLKTLCDSMTEISPLKRRPTDSKSSPPVQYFFLEFLLVVCRRDGAASSKTSQ